MDSILSIHSILRYLVLLFGVWAVFNAITGVSSKRSYNGNDNKSNLFFMILTDIQLLLGLILLYNWVSNSGVSDLDMGTIMKDKAMRFWTVEHPIMMFLAWIFVHVSRSASKKATTDLSKHKKVLIFSGLALLIMLASIPWPFREVIGRPLF